MTTQSPLTIARLEVSNVMRICGTVEIVPNASTITISGRNMAGKSSILNAIAMLFGGSSEMPERPLHDGTSRGHIIADLGDLVVTRKFSATGSPSISVCGVNGETLRSPQAVLDSLWNKMCDPVKFIRLSETPDGRRKQIEILRKLVNLDFSQLDSDREKLFSDRTLVNRDLATAQAKLVSFPADPTAPAEEVSVVDLMAKIDVIETAGEQRISEARKQNAANDVVRTALLDAADALKKQKETEKTVRDGIAATKEEIQRLEAKLKGQESTLESVIESRDTAQSLVNTKSKLVDQLVVIDEDAIRADVAAKKKPIEDEIKAADQTNVKVRGNRRRHEIQKEISEKQRKADSLTSEIEKIDDSKAKQLKSAKYPLPGLAFGDTGITLDGVPFSQGSTAEQTKAAVAIGIALNPALRVVLIRGGNDLDSDSEAEVRALASAHGFQIWFEKVITDDKAAFVIEDGALKE